MPRYDYRCRTCDAVYEQRRSMDAADAPATCPDGHVGAVRLLPVFATAGFSSPGDAGRFGPGGEGGMCGAPVAGGCGGGCACHAG